MPIKRANQSGMDEELLKTIINEAVSDLINKEYMETLIDKLKSNIEEDVIMKIAEATEPLESKISALEKKLQVYKAHMDQLEIKQDDAVQYSKRSCLRVFGIPLPSNENETESDYRDIANEMFSEMNVSIPEDGIDRIHRVGRKHKRADGVVEQAIIMKLSSWKLHTAVYKERKKLKSVKVRLDLTQRRANLLSKAMSLIKENPEVDFVFANINCHLAIRLKDGDIRYFNSEEDLMAAIPSIVKS